MSRLRFRISMSLDGFVAGPDQSEEDPLGEGGEQLHEWVFPLAIWRAGHGEAGGEVNASTAVLEEAQAGIGATIMGRNMFGGRGPWGDDPWQGWWGENPPYHHPVFVLTHHAREPLVMDGGTTFHFVTDGIESALEQARAAAGDQDVTLAGGAGVARAIPPRRTRRRSAAACRPDPARRRCAAVRRRRARRAGARVHARGRGARRHAPHLPGGRVGV